MIDLNPLLTKLEESSRVPKITAYNRIDGPGSSLDLREFQEAFWRLPEGAMPDGEEQFAQWSNELPRTVGITIDTGCRVTAHPLKSGYIGIVSDDYGYHQEILAGHTAFCKELWLLKILDLFGLSGVQLVLHNLMPGIKSSGLGGSATATTAVCLMANELAQARFTGEQLIATASLIEQDMGVSITGTQEQANVIYGGVTDYVWFPWGIPGSQGGFGTSIRRTLLTESDYPTLAARIRIYHSGRERASTDVNTVWRERLSDQEGYDLHLTQLRTAYEFREGLRLKDWLRVCLSIRQYRSVRVKLCADYMTSQCWDIQGQCENYDAESFPLGAGGGGAILICSPFPERLLALDEVLSPVYRRIPFNLRSRGHEFENIPDGI